MFKKLFCLFAMLVLVTACATNDDVGDGNGNNTGKRYARAGSEDCLCGVNVGDRVFFDLDRSDLKLESRATLDRQAAWLKKYSAIVVTVEGHCDERGPREYNIALGERRAEAVRNYLIAAGINADRIKTISYGKERPAVTRSDEAVWAQNGRAVLGSSEAAWSQNRRAVTVVTQ